MLIMSYVIYANALPYFALSCPAISWPATSSVCFTSYNFTSSIFSGVAVLPCEVERQVSGAGLRQAMQTDRDPVDRQTPRSVYMAAMQLLDDRQPFVTRVTLPRSLYVRITEQTSCDIRHTHANSLHAHSSLHVGHDKKKYNAQECNRCHQCRRVKLCMAQFTYLLIHLLTNRDSSTKTLNDVYMKGFRPFICYFPENDIRCVKISITKTPL